MKPTEEDEKILDWLNSNATRMCNRYPDSSFLCQKNIFWQVMKFCANVDQENYNFIPQTWLLGDSQELEKFQEYKDAHPEDVFIAKPYIGSQGDNVYLFQQLSDLPYSISEKQVVAQRYIKRPLLKNDYKFDSSIYIVVTGFNPIQAYICDEGLAKFCTVPYEAPERSNFKKAFMHLTNHIINM